MSKPDVWDELSGFLREQEATILLDGDRSRWWGTLVVKLPGRPLKKWEIEKSNPHEAAGTLLVLAEEWIERDDEVRGGGR